MDRKLLKIKDKNISEIITNIQQDRSKVSGEPSYVLRIFLLGFWTKDFALTKKQKELKSTIYEFREYIESLVVKRLEDYKTHRNIDNRNFLDVYLEKFIQ